MYIIIDKEFIFIYAWNTGDVISSSSEFLAKVNPVVRRDGGGSGDES